MAAVLGGMAALLLLEKLDYECNLISICRTNNVYNNNEEKNSKSRIIKVRFFIIGSATSMPVGRSSFQGLIPQS